MLSTPSYHISHLDNLAGILQSGGLWCDAERIRLGFESRRIAYEHLKERRSRTHVRNRRGKSVAAGGVLADYVPFYFANRSPMLYVIYKGSVPGYIGGQSDVVYLTSTVERIKACNCHCCFTDGHAVENPTDFFEEAELLPSRVDWDVIQDPIWHNRDDDPDRKRRKQAECLIHRSVSWDWFDRIGVIDQRRASLVQEIIAEAKHQPKVVIEPRWYYH
ncbi:MAG: toxin-antitoxin system toxin DarT [Isosphaeraceae bacterium]